jgi:glucosamine-6-phosphate deaminase
MRFVIAPTAADRDRLAARWIVESARPGRYLALAVGASQQGAYRELAGHARSLDGARGISLDELHPLPAGDPRSFGAQLACGLGADTGIGLERWDSSAADPQSEAEAVEARVRTAGLSGCVLGLGPNGHIAFNEPGVALDAPSRVTALDPRTVAHLGGADAIAPAVRGMTMGIPLLLSAARVLLLVVGDKADAFRSLVLGPLTGAVPATALRLHPDVTVLCTPREAAALPGEILGLLQEERRAG